MATMTETEDTLESERIIIRGMIQGGLSALKNHPSEVERLENLLGQFEREWYNPHKKRPQLKLV